MKDAVSQFPARKLTPDERALVLEWLAAAGDVTTAYVSRRSADDPALHQRIIICTGPGDEPSHIVHAPSGRDIWFVFSLGQRTKLRRFQTLLAALNSIRAVLLDPESTAVPVKAKRSVRASPLALRKRSARATRPNVG